MQQAQAAGAAPMQGTALPGTFGGPGAPMAPPMGQPMQAPLNPQTGMPMTPKQQAKVQQNAFKAQQKA